MYKSVLLLGTNLGDRNKNLQRALDFISIDNNIEIMKTSEVYASEAWGFDSSSFFNQAITIYTEYSPHQLLSVLQEIEIRMGRKKNMNAHNQDGVTYQDRVIDIDIIFYDDKVVDDPVLTIPHPLFHKRAFALMPVAEIEPQYPHPILKVSTEVLLRNSLLKSVN